jgi:cytochrome P450
MFEGHHSTEHGLVDDAAGSIKGYFREKIVERRAHPLDPEDDFVSFALQAKIFDRPCTEDEILGFLWTLAIAGLHTTRVQMVYLMHHFAATPADRDAVVAARSLIRTAIEESLRVHSIIGVEGRKVGRDIDFHGAPMKKGDMVWISVAAANRDPRVFPDPTRFDLHRKQITHLSFAAGPHRCLGSHLARAEMAIAVEEWHKRIPRYGIRQGETLMERGGLLTPQSLPLEW